MHQLRKIPRWQFHFIVNLALLRPQTALPDGGGLRSFVQLKTRIIGPKLTMPVTWQACLPQLYGLPAAGIADTFYSFVSTYSDGRSGKKMN
jgi:hypothetical protein